MTKAFEPCLLADLRKGRWLHQQLRLSQEKSNKPRFHCSHLTECSQHVWSNRSVSLLPISAPWDEQIKELNLPLWLPESQKNRCESHCGPLKGFSQARSRSSPKRMESMVDVPGH